MSTFPIWIFWVLTVVGTLIGLYVLTMAVIYIWIGRKIARIFKDDQYACIFENDEKIKPPSN